MKSKKLWGLLLVALGVLLLWLELGGGGTTAVGWVLISIGVLSLL